MRKLLYVLGAFILFSFFSVPARAQKLELFGGYSYAQLNPGGLFTDTTSGTGTHVGLSGWDVAVQGNMNRWLGLVADFSGYAGTGDIQLTPEHARINTMMVGPQLSLRGAGPFTFFVRGLVGATRNHICVKSGDPTDNNTLTRLSYGAGGGVDVALSKHVALRAIQLDHIGTGFPDRTPDTTIAMAARQRDGRVSAGIVFKF